MTFPANIDLTSLDGTDGFRFSDVETSPNNGPFAGVGIGMTVASAGDVNGDGFADIVVSAQYDGYGVGASYVVFGKASAFGSLVELSSLDGSNGFRMHAGGFLFGYSATAGDVNGDGFDDLIVGEPLNGGYGGAGAAYVLFGKATGFASDLDLRDLDGSDGFKLDDDEAGSRAGLSVASAGDINHDGFADVIVGAPGNSGKSYVVYGKASGFDPSIELSSLDGSDGFALSGSGTGVGLTGLSVASAGDVNGDGFDDLIVGGPFGGYGAAFVVFGSASGFDANVDLSTLDGTTGFRLNPGFFGYAGWSVASAGDVNGDGFDDVIVGEPGHPTSTFSQGRSYVVFGKASGFAASMALSDLDGTNGFRLIRETTGDNTGLSVASAGDVNGDGFDDVIVGAPGVFYAGAAGESYVVFGKVSGFAASIDLSSLDGSNGFSLTGGAGEGSGFSVASAGDVNGDGGTDLIVGGWTGTSHVVFGEAPADTTVNQFGTNTFDIIKGGLSDDNLLGLGGNDRMYAFAGEDLLSGGTGDDVLAGGAGDDSLVGGQGSDTAYYAAETAAVTASLGTGTASGASTGLDGLISIENLTGSAFNDTLTGNAGVNVLTGATGDDTLNGGGDADTMVGGTGNDTYYVNIAGDVVTEADGAGTDTVRSTITYALGSHLDNLILTGNAAIGGAGNELANRLTGNSAANVLSGGDGDDTYMVGAGDTVVENLDEGTDTVQSSISATLAANVENLLLAGLAAIDGTGNGLANMLTGNSAANVLSGGDGNDTYVIGTGDTVVENATEGTDTVLSSIDYTLAAEVENLTLTGQALNGTGNALANTLTGNNKANFLSGGDGNDRLMAGVGKDTLTGGNDADAFVFAAPVSSYDIVADFAQGVDWLEVSAAAFGGNLNPGSPPTVVNAAAAATASNPGTDGYFIFDNAGAALGTLYWDATGGSGSDAVAVAKLTGVASLAASDFQIV